MLLCLTGCNKSDSEYISGSGISGFWELQTDLSDLGIAESSAVMFNLTSDNTFYMISKTDNKWYAVATTVYRYDATAHTITLVGLASGADVVMTDVKVGSEYLEANFMTKQIKLRRHKAVTISVADLT